MRRKSQILKEIKVLVKEYQSLNEAKSFRARGAGTDIWIKKSPNDEISEKMYYALIELMKKNRIAPNQIIVTF